MSARQPRKTPKSREDPDGTIHRGIDIVGDEKRLNPPSNAPPKSNSQKLAEAGQKAADTLKKLDIFGKPIELLYNNEKKFKSVIGAMISLSVLGIVLGYFLWSLIFFVQRTAPIYSSVGETSTIPKPINLAKFNNNKTRQDLVCGLKVTAESEKNLIDDPTILNVTFNAYYKDADLKDSIAGNAIEVKCDQYETFLGNSTTVDEVTNQYVSYFKLFEMDQAKCFSLENYFDTVFYQEEFPIELVGTPISSEHKYMKIHFSVCRNNTRSGIVCKPIEEIRDAINRARVEYIFTHKVFVANNSLPVPLENITALMEFKLTKSFSKQSKISIQNNSLIDYYNLFENNPPKQPFMSYSSRIDTNLDYVDPEEFGDYDLLSITIEPGTTSDTFTRKYTSMKEFLVEIMGIVNGVLAGGGGFTKWIDGMIMKIDLINKTYFMIEDEAEALAKEQSTKKKKKKKKKAKGAKDESNKLKENEEIKEDKSINTNEPPKKKRKSKKGDNDTSQIELVDQSERDAEPRQVGNPNPGNPQDPRDGDNRDAQGHTDPQAMVSQDNPTGSVRSSKKGDIQGSKDGRGSIRDQGSVKASQKGSQKGSQQGSQRSKRSFKESLSKKNAINDEEAKPNEDKPILPESQPSEGKDMYPHEDDLQPQDQPKDKHPFPDEHDQDNDLSDIKEEHDQSPSDNEEEENIEEPEEMPEKKKYHNDYINRNNIDTDLDELPSTSRKKKKRRDELAEEVFDKNAPLDTREKLLKEAEKDAAKLAREGKIVNPYYRDISLKLSNKPRRFRKFKMTFCEIIMNFIPFCKGKELMAKKKIFAECGQTIDSLLGIERIVQTLREYEEFRNVVLNSEDYKLLKQLTTPKIVILGDEVNIKKIEKFNISDQEIRQSYTHFVYSINKLIDSPFVSPVENNLLAIHKASLHEADGEEKQ